MDRPVVSVCVSCGARTGDDDHRGWSLRERLQQANRDAGDVFKLVTVSCLDGCDDPCNVSIKSNHGGTWRLGRVDATLPVVGALVELAKGAAQPDGGPLGRGEGAPALPTALVDVLSAKP